MQIFLTSFNWWFFHWSLSDSKLLHVSRTLLSILTDLNCKRKKKLKPKTLSNG